MGCHLLTPAFALLCFALLCFALLCFALLCFALLCFALLCFALLCFALLWFALLCCVVLVAIGTPTLVVSLARMASGRQRVQCKAVDKARCCTVDRQVKYSVPVLNVFMNVFLTSLLFAVLKVIKGLFAMRADAIRQLSRVSLQLVVEMQVTMLAAGLEIPTEVAQNYKDACQERLEAVQRAMELRKLDEHFTAELLKRQNEKKTNNNSPTH
jgi:hypothetical protein